MSGNFFSAKTKEYKIKISDLIQSNFSTFFIQNIGLRFFSIITFFFITHLINPSEYALINSFNNFFTLFYPFVALGILNSLNALYFKLEKEDLKIYLSSVLILPIFSCLVLSIFLFFFRDFIKSYFILPSYAILFFVVTALSTYVTETANSINLSSLNYKVYFHQNYLKTFSEAFFSILIIYFIVNSWVGRIAGLTLSLVLTSCLSIYSLNKNNYIKYAFNKKYLISELKYAPTILLTNFSVFFINYIDKLILLKLKGAEIAGVFAVTATFSGIFSIFSTTSQQYFFPKIYERVFKNNEKAYFLIAFKQYISVLGTALILIILLTLISFKFFIGIKYAGALDYSILVLFNSFLWGVAVFFYVFFFYHQDKKKLRLISITISILALAIFWSSIKIFGAWGAAFGGTVINFLHLLIVISLIYAYPNRKN